jgi:hypothetical protein
MGYLCDRTPNSQKFIAVPEPVISKNCRWVEGAADAFEFLAVRDAATSRHSG